MKEAGFSPYDWSIEFLKTNGVKEVDKVDIPKFFETYLDTALRGFYAKGGKPSDAPSSSFIVFLADKLHTDPLTILDRYTPEAINFLAEGIEWNINASSKEGQVRNERKVHAKKLQE